MLSTRDPPTSDLGTHTDGKGMKKGIPYKWKSKESWSSNTNQTKIDFKIKTITRENKGHYRRNKGSVQEGDITILNTHALNIGAP